jgi:pyridoxal 5'-phosphate synthase pdxT subunit
VRRPRAPDAADADAHTGIGFEVPDVGRAAAELGHEPDGVARQPVADGRRSLQARLPALRLEQGPVREDAATDERTDRRIQNALLERLDEVGLGVHADTITTMEPLRIGVLAVQGNFREHAQMLRRLGADVVEVRKPEQLDRLDGLVIPGGESTTFMRLMRLYGLDAAIGGFDRPVFGTCAGMIVLDRHHLGLVDVAVRRNAFGRQVSSFETDLDVAGLDEPVRAVFIRAPWVEDVGTDVDVLAEVDGRPVLARQGRFLVAAFHPELTDDTRLHEQFLDLVREESTVVGA